MGRYGWRTAQVWLVVDGMSKGKWVKGTEEYMARTRTTRKSPGIRFVAGTFKSLFMCLGFLGKVFLKGSFTQMTKNTYFLTYCWWYIAMLIVFYAQVLRFLFFEISVATVLLIFYSAKIYKSLQDTGFM